MKRKIPCDAIYLDIDYMDGYRCFTWNKKYFPRSETNDQQLANEGFKTVVIIDPGIKVDNNYWVFKEGKEKKYFCRRCDDYFMEGPVWPGKCQFPDFTNPDVREWWGTLFKELVDVGVAGVWNDMNEPAVFGTWTFPDDVRHNYDGYRGSHRKAHNVYGMQMVRANVRRLKNYLRTNVLLPLPARLIRACSVTLPFGRAITLLPGNICNWLIPVPAPEYFGYFLLRNRYWRLHRRT